jgi:hypothetical protein
MEHRSRIQAWRQVDHSFRQMHVLVQLFLALFIDGHTHTDGLDWTATYSIHTTNLDPILVIYS